MIDVPALLMLCFVALPDASLLQISQFQKRTRAVLGRQSQPAVRLKPAMPSERPLVRWYYQSLLLLTALIAGSWLLCRRVK